MIVYTSITKSYLPKARILAKSVKKFHPNWIFVLLYSDDLPSEFNLSNEPFDELLMIDELGIANWKGWGFKHTIVELCTAVKGTAAEHLANRMNNDKIMYLDPDIKVFSSLEELSNKLDTYDILLTPHLLIMEENDTAIQDNEISTLKHGIYNLGFFAAKTSGQGLEFIQWWAARLRKYCFDDIPNGLFTDQKWCDLAPAFFSNLHILRDTACNVATWNIAHRNLTLENNIFHIDSKPLKFYHFTGYDSGAGFAMLEKYASNHDVAAALWKDYGQDLTDSGQNKNMQKYWKYDVFENDEKILPAMRKLYKSRIDLQRAFPNPFKTTKPSYYHWLKAEYKDMSKIEISDKSTTLLQKSFDTIKAEGTVVLLKKIFHKLNKK